MKGEGRQTRGWMNNIKEDLSLEIEETVGQDGARPSWLEKHIKLGNDADKEEEM